MWLIIALLPQTSIVLVGVALGFISLINMLNISPYRRVYKNLPEIEKSFSSHISAYIFFWAVQSIAMMLLAFAAGFLYTAGGYPETIFVVLLGMVLAYRFNNLQLLLQEVFFVKLKQKTATIINIASTVVFLAGIALIFAFPRIEIYVLLIAMKAILTAIGLYFAAEKELGLVFNIPKDWVNLVKESLKEFALFDHFIGASLDLVNKAFLLALSLFAVQGIMGSYTVALSLANALTLLPLVIYRTSMLAFARVKTSEGLEKVMSAFTKYSAITSVIQLACFLALLGTILSLLGVNSAEAWIACALIATGTTIFNALQPIHGAALLKTSTGDYFKRIILPQTIVAIGLYFAFAAYKPELIGVAYIFSAIVIHLLAYHEVKKNTGAKLRPKIIYPEELDVIRHFGEKIGFKKGKGDFFMEKNPDGK